jgi:hypothetical protein
MNENADDAVGGDDAESGDNVVVEVDVEDVGRYGDVVVVGSVDDVVG